MTARLPGQVTSIVVAVATAIVILAVAVVPFLTPAWVSFEQDRSQATAWTGYTPTELRAATDSILHDLVVGPARFDVAVRGEAVLGERERSHMVDVRGVFAGFALVAVAGALIAVAVGVATRGSVAFWRGLRTGAVGLVVGIVAVGMVAVFAFDAAFEIFHRLFFAGGTYTFDPRSARLVQLFPEQFWFETSLAVGALAVLLAVVAIVVATRALAGARHPVPVPARHPIAVTR